jgi:outer membrane murein-binding lipoprotein Lpp
MKTRLLVAAVVVGVLALPATAGAADPQISKLQKQVSALQKQVKKLSSQIKATNDQIFLNFEGDTCLAAQTADVVQGTWLAVDQALGKTIFGPQTPVPDYKNCSDLAQPDVPRPGINNPPHIDPFLPLLAWLHLDLGSMRKLRR